MTALIASYPDLTFLLKKVRLNLGVYVSPTLHFSVLCYAEANGRTSTMKLFNSCLVAFRLIVIWIYSEFFISLALAFGSASRQAFGFVYASVADIFLEFGSKEDALRHFR